MTRLRLTLAVFVGLLFGLGLFTLHYARGLSYLSDDPRACVNCHVMRGVYDSWQKGPHHAVAVCNDCHTPRPLLRKYLVKAENGWHHSSTFTTGRFPDTIMIRESNAAVLEENCRRCHQVLVSDIGPHRPSGDLSCVRCHASAGHGATKSTL